MPNPEAMDAEAMRRTSRVRASFLVPVLAALIGTFFYHRYSLLTGLDHVQADPGDSRFIAFLLEHWRNAVAGTADWRSPPIFWPLPGTLAYSDGLLAMGMVHAALRHWFGVFAAMNLQLILLSLGSFAAAYTLLARGYRLSVWGATLGAYFFAFSWPRFAQLVHVQLQFTVLPPLLVLLVLECARDGRSLTRGQFAWRLWSFVALLAVLVATTFYYAIFLALALTIAALLCLLDGAVRRHLGAVIRRQIPGLLGAAVLAALLIGPVIAFYLPLMRESRGRPWSEVLTFLPSPVAMIWMGRENWVWGWFFGRWPESVILARWPEQRIGIGLIASLAWGGAAVWSVVVLLGWRRRDRRLGPVALTIATGAILQMLMMRTPNGHSLWWLIWKVFPGAGGVRGVGRLELLIALAIGLALGALLDAALHPGRGRVRRAGGGLVLALMMAVEQFGSIQSYSGRGAEALSRMVADAVPRQCQAAYVVATPDLVTLTPDITDEAHFDGRAYLAANPDIAAGWAGTPWAHYEKFGRAEHRMLDQAQAQRHVALMFFAYNYTIPLAADLGGIPVVNGLSGWQPPGWELFDVLSPTVRKPLAAWLRLNSHVDSDVCVVPVRITLEMLPDLPPGLWP